MSRYFGSGIFCTGLFETPEEYITVGHVVDRSLSLERAVRLWRCVSWSVCTRKICVAKSVCCGLVIYMRPQLVR